MPAEQRKMDELTAQLLVEEQIEEEGSTNSTAFQMVKAGRKCFTWGKVGHYQRECKSNIKKSENYNNNKFQSRVNKGAKYCQQCKKNKSSKPITSNAFQVYVMPAINSERVSDEWVMDSGASEHMSHDKHTILGDGKVIQAVGVGDLKLQAHNGYEWLDTTFNATDKGNQIHMNSESPKTRKQSDLCYCLSQR
ncbi:hypothetical protein PR048_009244 [Dryococelus australis]|uniref:CCHC-type domain-containing protein n=1 Tax=Dryococelus australis TaxID=614101 RepID=A0ABQ9HZE8_9NEOP|nr:hypothetical protein PR048_009244 [Dryococelus australis]